LLFWGFLHYSLHIGDVMKRPFSYLLITIGLLAGTLGCSSGKRLPSTTDTISKDKDAEARKEKIVYYKPTNFPAAELWARPAENEIPLISAHRGKPELDEYVENSLEAIAKLIESGSFILELDIAKSKDGVLFLFHDDELDRLTRNSGPANARTWAELDTMRLLDERGRLSKSTIPSLDEALTLAKGKAMFTLDRKQDVPLKEISAAVTQLNMQTDVALILYDIDDFIEWANQETVGPISHEAPNVLVVEQLAQRCRELYKRVGISPFREEGMYPNSGFVGVGLPNEKILAVAKTLGIKTTVGTFGDLDQRAEVTKGQTYRDLVEAGVSIIATNKPLLAHKALYGK
jgi:glycerophosphoryl diester phosphodiesterase